MTQRRSVSTEFELTERHGLNVHLVFVEITSDRLPDPIRLVRDAPGLQYVWQGHTWVGAPFGISIMSDGEDRPESVIRIPNTIGRYREAIEDITDPPRVTAWVISSGFFDLTVNPRVELSTPLVDWSHVPLDIVDIQITPSEISGRIAMPDLSQEPVPFVRVTPDRFPGIAP
jgi:hypothetical protein